jgi:hypothetical protein
MRREPNIKRGQNPTKRRKILNKGGKGNVSHLKKRKNP